MSFYKPGNYFLTDFDIFPLCYFALVASYVANFRGILFFVINIILSILEFKIHETKGNDKNSVYFYFLQQKTGVCEM